MIPAGNQAQKALLEEIARRVTPSFDFFLFTLLSGLALSIAILIDSPAFFVLAALMAPFMAPVTGMAFATILGSFRFLLRMLGAILTGSLIIFGWGALTGWLARYWPGLPFQQVTYHALISWQDVVLLAIGTGLVAFTLVRSPTQRPLVISVAIAYELYLPIGVAGFGLTSGIGHLWPDALLVFTLHLFLSTLIGALVLMVLGLHPLRFSGYAISAIMLLGCLAAGFFAINTGFFHTFFSDPNPNSVAITKPLGMTATILPSVPPAPSATPQPTLLTHTSSPTLTATNTLVPSLTPTQTTTPVPTPVWAYIRSSEGGGAVIREQPSFAAGWAKSLLNGMLIQVLPDSVSAEGATWVKVRTAQGQEGWIVRTLLTTATPAPGG